MIEEYPTARWRTLAACCLLVMLCPHWNAMMVTAFHLPPLAISPTSSSCVNVNRFTIGGCNRVDGGFALFSPSFFSHPLSNKFTRKASVAASDVALSSSNNDKERSQRLGAFWNWAKENGAKIGGLEASSVEGGGLGLYATQTLKGGDVLMQVPTDLALTATGSSNTDDDRNRDEMPWYGQLSLRLCEMQDAKDDGTVTSPRAWLDVLPRSFSTPLHWSENNNDAKTSAMDELQYPPLVNDVARQRLSWREHYDRHVTAGTKGMETSTIPNYERFVWGCECARSRAFSAGASTIRTFNAVPFATTAVLVAITVGLGINTLEEAANGAALVLCAIVWKDFVVPKIFGRGERTYVICPVVDLANHRSLDHGGEVALEYFGGTYSLAVKAGATVPKGEELTISYGPRSNDQLLQYYGFVETDNVHDTYRMSPLKDWDLSAVEEACGYQVGRGDRLPKLEKAGLLGSAVTVTASEGVDPAILQALRALVTTDDEWEAAGQAVGNFAAPFNDRNERTARMAARMALQSELDDKHTTLDHDLALLQESRIMDGDHHLALLFRIEKKKLLKKTIESLSRNS